MIDDEVFEAVKKTLSDVQMDRPVEAIEQRGRARKRNRGVFGAVAGGALAAAAALALTLPGGSHQAGATSAEAPAIGGTTAAAPAIQEAAFTLTKQTDGSTKLTLDWKHILNPDALQKALAKAGIPAVVKPGVLCTPKGEQLPEAKEVFKLKDVSWPDGSLKQTDLVIAANKMPKGSVVYFSVFAIAKGEGFAKDAVFLVQKNAPMSCRTIG
jgi:hypothetical protein